MARLGQLIKKLEIGTDTAVDFLKSNGCEIKNDLNAKLDAHQEELLINKFASEEVKAEFAAKKQKKEISSTTENKPAKEENKLHKINVVGKIDLDKFDKSSNKKSNAATPAEPIINAEPKEKTPVEEPVKTNAEESKNENIEVAPVVKGNTEKPVVETVEKVAEVKPEQKNNPEDEVKIEIKEVVEPEKDAKSEIKPEEKIKETKVEVVDNKTENIKQIEPTVKPEPKPDVQKQPAENKSEKENQPKVSEKKTDIQQKNKEDKKDEAVKDKEINSTSTPEKDVKEEEIFKTDSHLKAIIPPKVIGKIDLDKINPNTRPVKSDKKSQEDNRSDKGKNKKKDKQNKSKADFIDKNKQNSADHKSNSSAESSAPNTKKDKKQKRRRINEQPVDVEAVIKDQNNQNSQKSGKNSKGKNKGDGYIGDGRDNRGGRDGRDSRDSRDNREVREGREGREGRNSKKNKQKYSHSLPPSEEEVNSRIQKTYADLQERNKSTKKSAQYRKEKREAIAQRQMDEALQEQAQSKILKLTEFVTVNELATMMNKPVNEVIQTCFNAGLFVAINQRLDAEVINLVADEFGFTTEFVSADVVNAIQEEKDKEEDLVPRPPIVTVMGHVDHGKTSLLDYIRKSNVIAGEAGGITQHIGAYNVQLEDGRHITFLDTPGHEAFTAMRARGAKVTDIVIIIVAADDDVMPQTVEAINHASAAGVPIVFAINKIDKPTANPEKVKESLANMNYLVEDWGGKYQSQDISAKKGIGVEELLEKVLIEAELLDLKANPNRRATGSVIESSLDKGRGYVATVLVSNGTLHIGDVMLAGTNYGRIKAMFNERGQRVKEAGPSEPVIVLGLNGAPQAGDNFNVFAEDHEAREIASKREQLAREQGIRTSKHTTLDEIGRRIALGNFQELNIIVKGDVDGSIEALSDSFLKLTTEEIQVNVIHKAVGQISESDVMLATASNAIIVGFQVRPSLAARKLAEKEGIEIRLYSIIYDAIEELKAAMEGMLAPDIKEEITASLEIRETFKITKVGTIAGCKVTEGKIKRTNKIRLIRDGIVIYTGELASLKRMKDDVKEVASGYECGLNIANYNDIKIGDIIEAFEEVEVKKSL
ncbi:MAG: translation initiation factor IF-2 [Candidatus Aphodosoma sp.]